MKKLKILVLMHADLVPPTTVRGLSKEEVGVFRTEWDVCDTLSALGHEVHRIGVDDELAVIRRAIDEVEPDVAFNLLEEFDGRPLWDHHVVSYLELKRVPYTGCNIRGLLLARDKALSKEILHYHRIAVPDWAVFRMGRRVRRPRRLDYPLFVKSLIADASLGISQASVVDTDEKLAERVAFIHRHTGTDAIAEKYIEGRELYVGVIGHARLRVLPVWELIFKNLPDDTEPIATEKAKFDKAYQKKIGLTTRAAKNLPEGTEEKLNKLCRRIYRRLGLTGYARMDFRMDEGDRLFLLEANPNPDIAKAEDFALSAKAGGLPYPKLLERLLTLALQRKA